MFRGEHGNGGKCYMTQMFSDHSLIHTASNGVGCRYGVAGGSVAFGYVPDSNTGRNFAVSDLTDELDRALATFDISSDDLPKRARLALNRATGFTMVLGVGLRGYGASMPVKKLLQGLQTDPQMVETLQACSVVAVVNGEQWVKGQPLDLPPIEPLPAANDPIAIEIPSKLVDPATEDRISTTEDGRYHHGTLLLRTSKANMNHKRRRSRHSVTFKSSEGFLGFIPVPEMEIGSAYANHIYGECEMDSLQQYKANDRTRLAPSPLTRAVEEFISKEIRKLAQEFEQRERTKYSQKERKELSEMNAVLDEWKNQFLSEMLGGGSGIGEPPRGQSLPAGVPQKMELTVTYNRMGRGVFMRPQMKFYDSAEKRIRPVPIQWMVDDPNILAVNELGLVNSFTYGKASLWAESLDDRLTSNTVPIEVVHICSIRIEPDKIEVPMGGRRKLDAVCTCEDGTEHRDILLIWTENDSSIARVSSSGTVFGANLGDTTVVAGDDGILAEAGTRIAVVQGAGGGSGKGKGRGFPLVLISGVDVDPDTNEVVDLTSGEPPVWQRAADFERNIWWINSAAPLARLYRDEDRGFGYQTREWRIYHVERFIDLISHIALSHEMDQSEMPAGQWYIYRGDKMVEIQERAAEQLIDFIDNGELPEV